MIKVCALLAHDTIIGVNRQGFQVMLRCALWVLPFELPLHNYVYAVQLTWVIDTQVEHSG